jgi:hypothetical protein
MGAPRTPTAPAAGRPGLRPAGHPRGDGDPPRVSRAPAAGCGAPPSAARACSPPSRGRARRRGLPPRGRWPAAAEGRSARGAGNRALPHAGRGRRQRPRPSGRPLRTPHGQRGLRPQRGLWAPPRRWPSRAPASRTPTGDGGAAPLVAGLDVAAARGGRTDRAGPAGGRGAWHAAMRRQPACPRPPTPRRGAPRARAGRPRPRLVSTRGRAPRPGGARPRAGRRRSPRTNAARPRKARGCASGPRCGRRE